MHDNLTFTGKPTITVKNDTGEIIKQFTVDNLVVSTGKQFFSSRAVGNTTPMQHMALGSDGSQPVVTNTTLGAEIARVVLSTATANANQVTYTASFVGGVGTGAIQEIGIFNSATNGIMLARTVFPVVNKAAGDSLDVSWVITAN